MRETAPALTSFTALWYIMLMVPGTLESECEENNEIAVCWRTVGLPDAQDDCFPQGDQVGACRRAVGVAAG